MSDQSYNKLEIPKARVRLLRVSIPTRRDALICGMVGEFHVALDAVQADAGCREVIIFGYGAAFRTGQNTKAARDGNVAGIAWIVERMHSQE